MPPEGAAPLLAEIDSFAWECSPADRAWTAELHLSGWASSVDLWLTDGEFVEEHPLRLIIADPHAAWEVRGQSLEVVGDPDDARSGSSTRFLCSQAPSQRIVVFTGDEISDCWSSDQASWPEDTPSCPIP